MFNPFSLTGKTVLVTGASSGIGRSIAVTVSKMGGRVIATGRNLERLQETLSLMEGEDNRIETADLTATDDIQRLAAAVPALDGIVHCAGVGSTMPAKMLTADGIDAVMHANFNSAALLQAALLSGKKVNRGASIVVVASKAADYPSVGNAVYSASKGALISYAHCLAMELAPRSIRVNCICPAMVWTALATQGEFTEEQLKAAEQAYPLKRFGRPEDVANLAVYLLSDASEWMTNSCIDITGGASRL